MKWVTVVVLAILYSFLWPVSGQEKPNPEVLRLIREDKTCYPKREFRHNFVLKYKDIDKIVESSEALRTNEDEWDIRREFYLFGENKPQPFYLVRCTTETSERGFRIVLGKAPILRRGPTIG